MDVIIVGEPNPPMIIKPDDLGQVIIVGKPEPFPIVAPPPLPILHLAEYKSGQELRRERRKKNRK